MLFSGMENPPAPPPQAVLNQRWLWKILIALLALCFILRFIGLDIPGALLTGLMLCFAIIMTYNGMQDIGRYALVFAVLCGLNFFFDILPLLSELGGRTQSKTVPIVSANHQVVYTVVVKSHPFFDPKMGFVYNIQSFTMILSPICMAVGLYLSAVAHSESQRAAMDWLGFAGAAPAGAAPFPEAPAPVAGDEENPQPAAPGSAELRAGANRFRRHTDFTHFQGQSHKLEETPVPKHLSPRPTPKPEARSKAMSPRDSCVA